MSAIFFYGLFMDRSLLVDQGLAPRVIGPAILRDYRIHIGARATLLPSPSRRAYGLVMELTDSEALSLYSEPSVREYVRERLEVELLDTGQGARVDCYNLPRDLGLAGANPTYANDLARLVTALGFDPAYADEIAAFGRAPE